MKSSNIGGQALIEGIMMRCGDDYSVAVRKPDRQILVQKERYQSPAALAPLRRIPVIRGVLSFVDSLIIGLSTLMTSAEAAEDETEEDAEEDDLPKWLYYLIFFTAFAAAVAGFVLVPYALSQLIRKAKTSDMLVLIVEAAIRIMLFLIYLALVGKNKDMERTFMYHGAEHKCINCVEQGKPLTVGNVMASSRFHKRCGTSFLFMVVLISTILLMLIHTDSHVLRIVYRLLLIPVIAGISFELLKYTGSHDNVCARAAAAPGLALQRLTTREPEADMTEVAIAAVEVVFDWRAYLAENFGMEFPDAEESVSEAEAAKEES